DALRANGGLLQRCAGQYLPSRPKSNAYSLFPKCLRPELDQRLDRDDTDRMASEYQPPLQKTDEWEPPMPAPDADGNYPAVEALRVSLARKILRHRRRVGWTQTELARRAGVRVETLHRIERGTHSPSVATIGKIERALQEAEENS